jgi:hypothetical protein
MWSLQVMLLSLHISPLPRTPNALLLRSSESGSWGVVNSSILVRERVRRIYTMPVPQFHVRECTLQHTER